MEESNAVKSSLEKTTSSILEDDKNENVVKVEIGSTDTEDKEQLRTNTRMKTEFCEESDSAYNSEVSNIYNSNDVNNILTEDILKEEEELEKKRILEEEKIKKKMQEENEKIAEEKCFKRLNLLLSRSTIYAQFMAEKLEMHETKQKAKEKQMQKKAIKNQEPVLSDSANKRSSKRKAETSTSSPSKKQKRDQVINVLKKENMVNLARDESETKPIPNESEEFIEHPNLFYGGVMRQYQLQGFQWLKTLFENGVNGILADEMGLGKTIQCIAFIAYLIEKGITGPFIVVAPLSTIPNWVSEFKRFTPDIPILLYHGHKDDRADLRVKITKTVKVKGKISCCPVVITSYQVPLIDKAKLSKIVWKMLVIDEAHRIKNYECMLIKALKSFNAEHRLLMTGTPLQNNLAELWSLLNFILPEIFDDLHVFESWFDIQKLSQNGATKEIIAKQQERQLISTIHQILTPFLLRRTKADVELGLPPKKEIVVQSPLTSLQHKYYTSVLNKTIAKLLNVQTCGEDAPVSSKRVSKKTNYFGCDIDLDNFSEPQKCDFDDSTNNIGNIDDYIGKVNLKMQNIGMILRKICNHPYLINDPEKPADEHLIKSSGKMLVLDSLLHHLKERGHKVIIFSQFVSMLNILEDYCVYRNYKYVSLYGSMNLDDRQESLEEYKDESTFIFLISTKAGGLGLNITSADTVIIYDSDWNPQGDLQAQDRCHRIGQTKPVIVYRLIVPNSVDQKIYDYATAKRKLEKAIIQKGRFNSNQINRSQKVITPEELLELLESSDNCGFVETKDVLSPQQIEELLDRSNMI